MRKILTVVALLTFYQPAQSQPSLSLEYTEPSEVGMSDSRLAHIERIINEAMEDEHIPGAVALVARKGKIVYHKAFGMADNQNEKSMEKDAIFRIASQTKAITSTAVMILWEEGRFRLDDPVSQYLPEFENMQILDSLVEADTTYMAHPAENQITIRHLLTHTSGIGYGVIDSDERLKKIYHKAGITDLFTTEDITIEDNVRKLAKLPLHHEPGVKWTYSEGLDILGYFIEVISGMPLDEFFRTRIFDPLGMDDTWFYLPESKADRLVTVQKRNNDEWVPYPVTFYDTDYPVQGAKRFYSGGAGLSSTALDYAKFLQMYLNKGSYNGNRILSRTTVDIILTNQIGDVWEGNEYGLAFGIVNESRFKSGGQGSIGTFEWGGYFNTQYFADPEEQIIGILMKQTQDLWTDPTGWQFRQIVSQAVVD
jgi:CubicO group peptidase (beta-lactamase class C family)